MYDVKLEAGVVGTLLLNPSFYYHFEALKPNHFHDKINASIYYVISKILNDGALDVSDYAIYLRLSEDDSIIRLFEKEGVDLQDFISKLKCVGTNDAEEYRIRCKKIIDYAFRRDSVIKLEGLAKYVGSNDLTANEANMHINDEMTKFAEKYVVGANILRLGDVLDDILLEIEERQINQGGYAGLPSKFPIINEYFTYEKGELILVGARAKTGKSFFGLNETFHKLKNGVPVGYLDTEMSTREFVIRAVSLLSGISVKNIKTGMTTTQQKEELKDIYAWIKKQPLVHIYNPDWKPDEIYLTAKELQKSIGMEFMVYDYIKASGNSIANTAEHNVLGNLTNFMKNNVAGKLDIPILTFAQMSPHETRLADSDKINRYASVIAYFMKKEPEEIQRDGIDGGNRKLIIDYNRLGEQFEDERYISLLFDGNHAVINQAKRQPTNGADELFNKK